MNSNRIWPAALLAVALASCSKSPEKPATYPVSGRVLYEGNPASGAVVMLHLTSGTIAERPCAKADEKGEFTLMTYTPNDGAPAGDYAITVEKKTDGRPGRGVGLLPAIYGDPKTTPLKTTIVAGQNELLVLRLSRHP